MHRVTDETPVQVPTVRPRRLRRTPALRRMVAEHHVVPSSLVLPVFVR
jgi:porphobilinogen synthase